jgi:transcriptional regulator with XRE-family HTH domain
MAKERDLAQKQLAFRAEVAMRYIEMIKRPGTSATVGMLCKLAATPIFNLAAFLAVPPSP